MSISFFATVPEDEQHGLITAFATSLRAAVFAEKDTVIRQGDGNFFLIVIMRGVLTVKVRVGLARARYQKKLKPSCSLLAPHLRTPAKG